MKKIIILISAITFILLGSSSSAQEKKFLKACEKNTVESYNEFLLKYPSSEFAHAAEFKKAKLIDTKEYWSGFIKQFPDGVYHDSASLILCKSEADEVKKTNTKEAYKKYVKEYSTCNNMAEMMQGYYNLVKVSNDIDALNDFIALSGEKYATYAEEISYLKAKKINTIEEWNHFLGIYKNSKYEGDAKRKIEELTQSLKWAEVKKVNTIESYEDAFYNIPQFRDRARDEIKRLYIEMVLSNKNFFDTIYLLKTEFGDEAKAKLSVRQQQEISQILSSISGNKIKCKIAEKCHVWVAISYDQSIYPKGTGVIYREGNSPTKSEQGGTMCNVKCKITDYRYNISIENLYSSQFTDGYVKRGTKEVQMFGATYGVDDSNVIIDFNKTKQILKKAWSTFNPYKIEINTEFSILH